MTKKIRSTDASLLAFLNGATSKLFERYEQLNSFSQYWTLLEQETKDTYRLSFYLRAENTSGSLSKIEIPLTDVEAILWLECRDKKLEDLSQRIFSVPLRPYMTFKLTIAVDKSSSPPRIILKSLTPGGFDDYRLTSEPSYETRADTA